MDNELTRQAFEIVLGCMGKKRDALDDAMREVAAQMPPPLSKDVPKEAPRAASKPPSAPEAPPKEPPAPIMAAEVGLFSGLKLWEAADKLLAMEGHQMGVTDMVARLRQGKLHHISRNLDSNLQYAMGAKPDRFTKIAPGTWNLNRNMSSSQAPDE